MIKQATFNNWKLGAYCCHMLSLRKHSVATFQNCVKTSSGSKILLHTEQSFVKSYYTLVNSYWTLCVPKHTIVGPETSSNDDYLLSLLALCISLHYYCAIITTIQSVKLLIHCCPKHEMPIYKSL